MKKLSKGLSGVLLLISIATVNSQAGCHYSSCRDLVMAEIIKFKIDSNVKFNNLKIQREKLYQNYKNYKTVLDEEIELQNKLIKLKVNNIKNLEVVENNRKSLKGQE